MDTTEQEQQLRTVISDAIQDSLTSMMLDDETLENMVDNVFFAIANLVGYRGPDE